jgi:hypothetical protein
MHMQASGPGLRPEGRPGPVRLLPAQGREAQQP